MTSNVAMKIVLLILQLCLCGLVLSARAESLGDTTADTGTGQVAAQPEGAPDSQQMSRDLQSLPWKPFKAIIQSIPKLAADVDAYGPLGWQFVRENYTTYNWKKKIDKLDAEQKKQLADLIRKAHPAP